MTRTLALAALALLGCTETHTIAERDGEVPRGVDASAFRVDAGPRDAGPPRRCVRAAPVDLLLVVDNSNSMTEEQASLATGLPLLMRALASGDIDGDGTREFLPVEDLHVGVITTDMGTGGFRVPTCVEPNFGDDGILRTAGNTSIAGCRTTYPAFLTYTPGVSPGEFAADVTCVAHMGTGGCGFEQQLEAALKAVLPSGAPVSPPFVMGSVGHGDRENSGFLREDSLLSVVFLTDEEDCSALDPSLFDPMSATYVGDLNLRCFLYPAAVHPVSRYVDGLRSLRPSRPDLLALGFIVGIPPELDAAGASGAYDLILADERMQERIDTGSGTPRLVPSCNVPGRGVAFPPRRLVEVARQMPEQSVVQSICQHDFSIVLRNVVRVIGRRACAEFE